MTIRAQAAIVGGFCLVIVIVGCSSDVATPTGDVRTAKALLPEPVVNHAPSDAKPGERIEHGELGSGGRKHCRLVKNGGKEDPERQQNLNDVLDVPKEEVCAAQEQCRGEREKEEEHGENGHPAQREGGLDAEEGKDKSDCRSADQAVE